MKANKGELFSLKTPEGCKRLLAVFLVVLLLSGFAARMIASDMGKVKISNVKIDTRGAMLDGDLYYPAGTSDSDKLPGILLAHGGGVEKGVMTGISTELARRGFVVLNTNAYGVSMSEQPVSDDGGQGEGFFNPYISPCGVYDALDYLRSLKFVDQTRIGMGGHSLGSMRTAFTSAIDCGYFTRNDLLINILYDEFGQRFTEAEIVMDANTLAQQRLN